MKFSFSQTVGWGTALVLWLGGALCVLPILLVLGGAFWHNGHPSFAHLTAAFAAPDRLVHLMSNSLCVASGAACVAAVLGTPIGFLCFRTNLPLRKVIIAGCLVAALVPLYVTATCWMALFGMRFWLYNVWGAAWITGIAYTPLVALITGVCFAASDREIEEVTALDTGRRGVFWHATVPMSLWGIAVALASVVILSLCDITVTDILTVRTFSEEVFTQFQLGAGPWSATALSFPVIAMVFALWVVIFALVRGHGESSLWGRVRQPGIITMGGIRYLFLAMVLAVAVLFFFIPVGALVRALGSPSNLLTAWRTANVELTNTLRVTSAAATITVLLATAAAWAMLRNRLTGLAVGLPLLLMIAVPAPVVGIGLIHLLNREGFAGAIYDSEAGLVLAYVIRTLPFAVMAILPAMRGVPREIEETMRMDGANWLTTLVAAVLPMSWRGIAVAWFLAFVLMISEMGASFLVVPPGRATLSIRFFTLIHYGVYPDAAGICLILLLIVAVGASVIGRLLLPMLETHGAD